MDNFFENLVKDCRDRELTTIIHNASMEHAKVLFQNLFEMAAEKKEDIKLISDSLIDQFYNELLPNIQSCLTEGCKIEVIVLDSKRDLTTSKFSNLIKKHGGNVLKANVPNALAYPNFIIIGNKRFRFEEDKTNKKAIACFNNEEIVSTLIQVFNSIKTNSKAA